MIVTVDGDSDENSRYANTVNCAINYFNEHDLHAYFIATQAPGRSGFSRMERRIADLSKELSGIILEHDYFDTHLDNNNNAADEEVEFKTFEYAGKILAEFWSKSVINYHTVVAELVGEAISEITIIKSKEWKANHVRDLPRFQLNIIYIKN